MSKSAFVLGLSNFFLEGLIDSRVRKNELEEATKKIGSGIRTSTSASEEKNKGKIINGQQLSLICFDLVPLKVSQA